MFHVKTRPNEQKFSTNENESILEAAIRQKVMLPYGCGNGQCGSCKVFVTQGEFEYLHDYKPEVLSEQDRNDGAMLCCMAKARSDLELLIPENNDYPEIEPQRYQSKVIAVDTLTDNVYKLVLEINSSKFDYYPGQYIELLLQGEQKRAYSLACLPERDNEKLTQKIELHIRAHEKGLFSELLRHEISTGYPLMFEGPRGHFLLNQTLSSKVIFIAGGTGIVPIKLLLEDCLSQAQDEEVYLFWGVKNQHELFHNDFFVQLSQENINFHYIPVLTEPDQTSAPWHGASGIVINSVVEKVSDLSKSQVYAAGPQVMIQSCQTILPAFGLSEDDLYTDVFLQPGKSSRKKKRNIFQKFFS